MKHSVRQVRSVWVALTARCVSLMCNKICVELGLRILFNFDLLFLFYRYQKTEGIVKATAEKTTSLFGGIGSAVSHLFIFSRNKGKMGASTKNCISS